MSAAVTLPSAVADLQTAEGAALVGARWRYADAEVREIAYVAVGHPDDPLGPGVVPNRTYDVVPHAEGAGFDDSDWRTLEPEETQLRLAGGRVCFNWYRTAITLPERIGDAEVTGATIVFEVVVDDYAEVWVNGELPHQLGDVGGPVAAGFNAPNRVVLTRDARPGDRFVIAVFGINGPISASPRNYIWMRSATLDVLPAGGYEQVDVGPDWTCERVASGFVFTEGPVWHDGALLFSSPNTNEIQRWTPGGDVTVFRTKSGYAGTDIGRYAQPGSNGLAFDPEGRLLMCQHGNRRVLRVNPHGDTTVIADRFDGRRLNSPNDLVCRSDGTVFFTDPPFGLPGVYEDAAKELPFSGVFAARAGGDGFTVVLIDDRLRGPNGIAFSGDERTLYVGNWDFDEMVVVRYEIDADARVLSRDVLFDMTGAGGPGSSDAIDGLEVGPDGTLYVCGPGGIWVISADGEHHGTIELPEAPHNLAWGDDDRRALYVTALTSVYRLRPTTGATT